MSRRSLLAIPVVLLVIGAIALLMRERGGGDVDPAADHGPATYEVPPEPRGMPRRNSVVPGLVEILSDLSLHRTRHIEAVRGLPREITMGELGELVDLIRGPVPENRNPDDWHLILNEIMNVLHEPRCDIGAYQVAMADIMRDPAADPVVRDYAAQHLTLTIKDPVAHPDPVGLDLVMESCFAVLADRDNSFEEVTGTILLSLCSLHDRRPPGEIDPYRKRLQELTLPMVEGAREVSRANRVSAIQAAGRLKIPAGLPAIRRIARDERHEFPVRLSAVASLGYFAEPVDQELLLEIAQGEPRLVAAAETALKSCSNESSR